MKDFYSLVYVKSNVLTDELILIGLITNLNNHPQFYFSENRMKLVSKSVSKSVLKGVRTAVSMISNEIIELNKMPNYLPLFDHSYSMEMISKTASYNKNVLIYGRPSEIETDSKVSIEDLIKSLFSENYHPKDKQIKKTSFRSKWLNHQKTVNHSLIRKFTLSSDQIGTIYSSHQIDLIGCYDDRIYTFHSIDFNSSPKTIEKNIFEFSRLIRGVEAFGKKKGLKIGVHYLIYDHPKKKLSKEIFYKAEEDQSKGFTFLRMKDFERELKSLRIKDENNIENLFL